MLKILIIFEHILGINLQEKKHEIFLRNHTHDHTLNCQKNKKANNSAFVTFQIGTKRDQKAKKVILDVLILTRFYPGLKPHLK